MAAFAIPIRIYIEDTDAGGLVYYVNYFKFMERCRTEFLRSLGYDKPAILDGGLLLVVHSAQANYRRPARLDDALQATAQVVKLARTYVEFEQKILRADELLCEAKIRVACVDGTTMKPHAISASMYDQIKNHTNATKS